MKALAYLLAALTLDITEYGPPTETMPPNTIMNVVATVCVYEAEMNRIIDAEVLHGNGEEVFNKTDGCGNFCVGGIAIKEVHRFRMQNGQLFGVFTFVGLSEEARIVWISTAITESGWPITGSPESYESTCDKEL